MCMPSNPASPAPDLHCGSVSRTDHTLRQQMPHISGMLKAFAALHTARCRTCARPGLHDRAMHRLEPTRRARVQARALAETWRQECGASPRSRVLAVQWSQRGGLLLLTDEGPLLLQRLPGQAYRIAQTLPGPPAAPAGRPACVPEFAEWSPCGDKACVVRSLPSGPELCMFSAETGHPLFSQGLSCPGQLFWLRYWRTPRSSKFCVSPDGKHLAVLDRAQTLRIVNTRTSAVQLRRESERNALEVRCPACCVCSWAGGGAWGRLAVVVFRAAKPSTLNPKAARLGMSTGLPPLSSNAGKPAGGANRACRMHREYV